MAQSFAAPHISALINFWRADQFLARRSFFFSFQGRAILSAAE